MPDPGTLLTGLKVASAAAGAVGAFSRLGGDPAKNLRTQILYDQLDWRKNAKRRAKGMWTTGGDA